MRNHAVANFAIKIFREIDQNKFELYAYNNDNKKDEVSREIESYCMVWRDIYVMNDKEVAALIFNDELDMLIDLSGHTAGNRLKVFMYKPAPLQMSTIGYPLTTGLRSMDYYYSDRLLNPAGLSDDFYTEKLMCIDKSILFDAIHGNMEVGELPALKNKYITFGSFNRPNKINKKTIAYWCEVLNAIPDSRMIIAGMTGEESAQMVNNLFIDKSIDTSRLSYFLKTDFLKYHELHNKVDIHLDAYPYGGGTTGWHSVWMGVPILSLSGKLLHQRTGLQIMQSLGFNDWSSERVVELVQKAKTMSKNLEELAYIRKELRNRYIYLIKNNSTISNLEKALTIAIENYRLGKSPARIDV